MRGLLSIVLTTVSLTSLAGSWVPFGGKCYRYNQLGYPLAEVTSPQEVAKEDARLEALGYQLTDKERVLPEYFFTWKSQEEE